MEDIKTDHVTPPTTPPSTTPPSPVSSERPMGLSSPQLLRELQQPHALKHVSVSTGLKTVFCGRGRQIQEDMSESKTST